ncbi:MAG: pinensin family lanthipeptide [Bacteroidota bacterium]
MKKSKLNLKDLKVESFVTNIQTEVTNTVKGGRPGSNGTIYNTNCCSDDDHCFSRNGGCDTIFERHCHKQ